MTDEVRDALDSTKDSKRRVHTLPSLVRTLASLVRDDHEFTPGGAQRLWQIVAFLRTYLMSVDETLKCENRPGVLADLYRRRQAIDEQRNKERKRHAEEMAKYDNSIERLNQMIEELEQSPDVVEKMERVLALL